MEELNCSIGGWLCDKQNGFIPAIESVFEGVPIHLCQAHFLKSMGKPVQLSDSEMGKAIKKTAALKADRKRLGISKYSS